MERHFILPLTIAAAAHLGLLFGIPGGPAKTPVGTEKPLIPETLMRIIQYLPEPTPEPDESVKAIGKSVAPPTLPDPPAVEKPDAPTMELPPRVPASVRVDPMAHIGPIGVLEGSIDAKASIGGGIAGIIDLDAPPRARVQMAPVYPVEAKRNSRGGEVLVEFTVDEQGAVVSPRVVRSSDRIFEDATLHAVSRWRFEPGKRAGQIVRFRMAVPVVFNLNEN